MKRSYEREIKAMGEAGVKIMKGISFSINVNKSAFIVGIEKVKIHMFPIRFSLHKDLHRKITAKAKTAHHTT